MPLLIYIEQTDAGPPYPWATWKHEYAQQKYEKAVADLYKFAHTIHVLKTTKRKF